MTAKYRSSLTAKIFVITASLLIAACVLTYCAIAYFMPKTYSSALSLQLERRVEELIEQLQFITLSGCGELLDTFLLRNQVEISLYDANGQDIPLPTTVATTLAPGTFDHTIITSVPNDDDSFAISIAEDSFSSSGYPVRFSNSDAYYTLVVTAQLPEVNQAVAALDRILPLVMLIVLLISLVGALVYSRYVTHPIVQLSNVSSKMSHLEFGWQCEERRTDEIGVLARSLNQMSARLSQALSELRQANQALQNDIARERSLEKQRVAFFSAASHELKTPITVLKGQLEGMLHEIGVYRDRETYLARSLAVAGQLETMVQELLTVSRMDNAGFALRRCPFDLVILLQTQLHAFGDLIEQRGLQVHTCLEAPQLVMGDRVLLGKALHSILANAVQYCAPGKDLFIKAYDRTVSIENAGAPIPDADLPHLFEAFYRVEQSRNRQTGGSGLGLYLVKLILDLHGAQYAITNTASGVCFQLTLP